MKNGARLFAVILAVVLWCEMSAAQALPGRDTVPALQPRPGAGGMRSARLEDLPADLRAQLLARRAEGPARVEPGLRESEDGSAFVYGGPRCAATSDGPQGPVPYTAALARDLSGGVEVTASGSAYPVRLIPLFWSGPGRIAGEALEYSLAGSGRAVYTFMGNGVKEEIVLDRVPSDNVSLGFRIEMDPVLEARLDGKGNVLIYGPDAVLGGFIQTDDQETAQRVLKARQRARKDRVLYVIPAPVVFDAGGSRQAGKACYTLNGATLSLHASGLSRLNAPVTIDPSIVVTTTADFASGNDEGLISFDTDAISRAVLSNNAGAGAWSTLSSFATGRSSHASVAHNGYLYVVGGWDGATTQADVQLAPISADGSIGTWTATVGLGSYGRQGHTCHAYNGYLYVVCGAKDGSPKGEILSAPINPSDGTLTGWTVAGDFGSPRYNHTSAVYNGYLYVLGGRDLTQRFGDVRFAPLRGDGTVGAFAATSAFNTARAEHASVSYDGYLYVIGGNIDSALLHDVQYAPVRADGSLGAWRAAHDFSTTGRAWLSAVADNGYLYVLGGYTGSYSDEVRVARIDGNGSLGPWKTTSPFNTALCGHAVVAYKGHLYATGGWDGSTHDTVQYAGIESPAMPDSWVKRNNLWERAWGHTSAVYGHRLYVVGGWMSGGPSPFVSFCSLSADGDITPSEYGLQSFAGGRWHHSTVAYNGYLYVIGGEDEPTYYSDVQKAHISSGGWLGPWEATTALPAARTCHSSVAYNGYLYVIGGGTDEVLYAPILSSGTVGAWTATTPLPEARSGHASVVYNGYLYVLGGSSSIDVLFAPIHADGTLGTWTSTTGILGRRWGHTAVAFNGRIYLVGGYDGFDYRDEVESAPVQGDGALGPWTWSADFGLGREWHTSVTFNGHLYIIGGFSSSLMTSYETLSSSIGAQGSLASGWADTTALPLARSSHAAVASNGYLYVLGGTSGGGNLNDVWFCAIGEDGTLGPWAATTTFPTPRAGHAAVAHRGRLYVLGGYGTGYLNDVWSAPVNTYGWLGTWVEGASFGTPRASHAAVVSHDRLYVLGGRAGTSSYLSDVQVAPVGSDGAVGPWSSTTGFATARYGHAAAVYNDNLYVVGGYDGGYLGDVQYAPIHADGTVGAWSNTAPLDIPRRYHTAAAYNGFLYVLCGDNGSPLEDVQYGMINSDGSVGGWETTVPAEPPMELQASALYDGNLYIIGGTDGTDLLDEVQVAAIQGPPARGRYSRIVDLGSNKAVDSVSFSRSDVNGKVDLTYAMGTPGFGARTTVEDAEPGTPYTSGLGCGRYVWAMFDLDDTDCVTLDAGGASGRGDLLDFTVNYTEIVPAGVTATATAPNEITVSWGAVAGATSYSVYRRVGACGGSTSLLASGVTGTSHVDSTVSGGTTYGYRIVAVMPGGCSSSKSSCAQATATGDCYLAPAFSGLTGAQYHGLSGTCRVHLTWGAATSNCPSGPGISYHIYRSTESGFVPGASNRIAQCVAGTSYDDADIAGGATYYYIVRAEDTATAGGGPCNGGNTDANTAALSVIVGNVLWSSGFETALGWVFGGNWARQTGGHTGSYSAYSGDAASTCGLLRKSTPITIPADAVNPRLRFWTRHSLHGSKGEAGIVQGTSNGTTWTKLTVSPAYPGNSDSSTDACLGTNPQPAFVGFSDTWTEYTVDLTPYKGGNFNFRFNVVTSGSTLPAGRWEIDDVSITRETGCSYASHPGAVPDTLTVSKFQEDVVLNWAAPAGGCTFNGYGVYRGTLPMTGYDHASLACGVIGTTYTDANPAGDYYYLVVPLNTTYEGQYGTNSSGSQLPQGTSPCRTQDAAPCS